MKNTTTHNASTPASPATPSTSATPVDPRAPATPLERLQGAALIAAPALLTASSVAYGLGTGFSTDHLGGTLQVYSMAAFPLALLGLIRRLERLRPRAAAVLSALAVLGAAGGVAFGVDAAHVAVHPESPVRQLPLAPLFLFLPGLVFPLTLIGTGIALARSGAAPRWSGYLLAAGGVFFPLSRIPRILEIALFSDFLIFAALAPLGWAILRRLPINNAVADPSPSTPLARVAPAMP